MFVTIMVSVFVLHAISTGTRTSCPMGIKVEEMSQITSCDPAFPADLYARPHLELLWFIQRVCMFIFRRGVLHFNNCQWFICIFIKFHELFGFFRYVIIRHGGLWCLGSVTFYDSADDADHRPLKNLSKMVLAIMSF